jgi:hypothetical protein
MISNEAGDRLHQGEVIIIRVNYFDLFHHIVAVNNDIKGFCIDRTRLAYISIGFSSKYSDRRLRIRVNPVIIDNFSS